MKLSFVKTDPSENMTVFILDPLPRETYPVIAKKLMNYNNIYAEQVGFIEKSNFPETCSRLHMMGGEFCGNAVRAFAALMLQKDCDSFAMKDDYYVVPVEVSGVDQILYNEVKQLTDHTFDVKVNIPLHKSISPIETDYNGIRYQGTLIEFDGIAHIVILSNCIPNQGLFFKLMEEMSLISYDALGMMFYNEEENFLTPLVYVRGTDSYIWERSCGTGTAALGIALSLKSEGSINKEVRQPGGSIRVLTTMDDGYITNIYLKGNISIVAEGVVYI